MIARRQLPWCGALWIALALLAARASAASDGISITLPVEGCTYAQFGTPALLPVRRNLVASVAGYGCSYVGLLDGRTGAELRRFKSPLKGALNRSSAKFGDAAGLLGHDLLVGSPGEYAVHAFDLRTGALVRTYQLPISSGEFEQTVIALGRHVVVGAPNEGLDPFVFTYGAVYVFDARSGRLERSIRSPAGANAFGSWLAPLAGDRVAVGTLNAASSDFGGRIYVVDVRSGEVLLELRTPAPGQDGNADGAFTTAGNRIVVGVPGNSGGAVFVYDARRGRLLRTIANPGDAAEAFGAALAVRGRKLLVVAPFIPEPIGPLHPAPTRAAVSLFDVRTGRLRGRILLDAALGASPPAFLRHGFAYAAHPDALSAPGAPGLFEVAYRYRLPSPP